MNFPDVVDFVEILIFMHEDSNERFSLFIGTLGNLCITYLLDNSLYALSNGYRGLGQASSLGAPVAHVSLNEA
jgi:hypothetical protein